MNLRKRRLPITVGATDGARKKKACQKAPVTTEEGSQEVTGVWANLPQNAVLSILKHSGVQRLQNLRVCRQWNACGRDDPAFTRRLSPGQSLTEACEAANPGDTILIPPDFYEEMALISKPVKLVGTTDTTLAGQHRNAVIFQSSGSVVLLCNARCHLQNIKFRTCRVCADRSVIAYGPACPSISLDSCELEGFSGLLLPETKGRDTRLIVKNTRICSVGDQRPGISVENGLLHVEGCTITNCYMGINVDHGARVCIQNNDISFNDKAIMMSGTGSICNNIVWGNISPAPFDISQNVLAELSQQQIKEEEEEQGEPRDCAFACASAAARGPVHGLTDNKSASPVYISGNHVKTLSHRRGRRPADAAVRRKVRSLAAEVYGRREYSFDDWHMIDESDLEDEDDEDDVEFEHEDNAFDEGGDVDGEEDMDDLDEEEDIDVELDALEHEVEVPEQGILDFTSSDDSDDSDDADFDSDEDGDVPHNGPWPAWMQEDQALQAGIGEQLPQDPAEFYAAGLEVSDNSSDDSSGSSGSESD